MTPIRRVSPAKFAQPESRPAKVKVRVKGSGSDGAVYEGQRLIVPCSNCGSKSALVNPS